MTPELERHARLLRWNAWANRETRTSLRPMPVPAGVRWLGHIAAAERLWLGRLTGEPSDLAVWPELSLDAIGEVLARLTELWPAYLAGLGANDLADGIGYRNSRGEFWTSSVEDILTHVVSHSAYHRGQIAAAVRAAGGDPANTDFIHAVRQGLVE